QPIVGTQNPAEGGLVAAAKEGDQTAFGTLVDRYAGVVRRVARSILGNDFDADDAAQDAFLLAWRNLDRFDPERPFRPWLMRIVVNAATDLYRRRKVRHAGALPETLQDRAAGPDRETDRALLRERLSEALAELSERHRAAITMFDGEGYSHADIAEIMDVPVGTVRSLVFHARRALRKALAPYRGGST
ncbi:MAG: sigma-70 family RNA polymerase sigma factor, partial [Gemmatimonadales bacterium]